MFKVLRTARLADRLRSPVMVQFLPSPLMTHRRCYQHSPEQRLKFAIVVALLSGLCCRDEDGLSSTLYSVQVTSDHGEHEGFRRLRGVIRSPFRGNLCAYAAAGCRHGTLGVTRAREDDPPMAFLTLLSRIRGFIALPEARTSTNSSATTSVITSAAMLY